MGGWLVRKGGTFLALVFFLDEDETLLFLKESSEFQLSLYRKNHAILVKIKYLDIWEVILFVLIL